MATPDYNSTNEDDDGSSQRAPTRSRGAWSARLVAAVPLVAAAIVVLWLLLGTGPSAATRAAARPRHVAAPAAASAAAASAASAASAGSAASAASAAEAPKLPQAEVAIAAQRSTISVPRSFLGLSTEYWSLPLYEDDLHAFEHVLGMLHVGGDGPLVLRIGGDSADRTYWDPRSRILPQQLFGLTPAWLREAATLVRRTSTRVILDLNLISDSPAMAAHWAQAALAELPHRSLVGFEIGNEPDLYHREFFSRLVGVARGALDPGDVRGGFSALTYTHDFGSYARALSPVVGKVPLLGPAVANPALDVGWLASLVAADHRQLGMLSAHRYPLSACKEPSSPLYPTIDRLLSERSSSGLAASVRAGVAIAHRAGLRFRLTELNSVTCGGRPGVSNSFATALWAPDALFELVRAGVDGVNVHIRVNAINPPFALVPSGLRARPLLYGLIMFTRTLGPGSQLVPLDLREAHSLHLKVWGVRVGSALHVLVINKGKRAADIHLTMPASAPGTVQRLLAPSAAAQSGVTLAGQQLGLGAVWQGHRVIERIDRRRDGYGLVVPRWSAALVQIPR